MSEAGAPGAVYEVLDELRASSQTEVEKGQRFERLMREFLRKEPTFEDRFEWVKLWGEWDERTDSDTGIDLVALDRRTQKVCAVQCKFYADDAMLQKKQVDSFLATVGQERFGSHILIHTAGGIGNHLVKALDEYDPRVIVLDVDDLAKAEVVSWPSLNQPPEELENKVVRHELRPHQQDAVDAVAAAFDGTHKGIGDLPAGIPTDRGKLIMACGSGKTYTALKIAEQIVGAGGNVLYLIPSISLLGQTLKEWSEQRSLPHNYVGICSDTSAGKNSEDERVEGLTIPVSTNPENIAAAFAASKPDDLTVCFSTYQSIAKVKEAQEAGAAPEFDLIFADEAHRTTGLENEEAKTAEDETGKDDKKISPFIRIHDSAYIKGHRRLYLSATPRVYASGLKAKAGDKGYRIFSMDDVDAYGEELYRLSFGEAVEAGILSDYRVAIIWVDEDKTTETASIEKILSEQVKGDVLDVEAAAKMTGLIKLLADPSSLESETELGGGNSKEAVERQSLSRAIVFANSIKFSEAIVEALPKVHLSLQEDAPIGDPLRRLKVEPRHTDGTNKAKMRQRDLAWLNLKQPDTAKILSNARCLAEGVDIPALDAAVFMSPRNSYIDIIQAVGRVMRKAPGKEYGYILIPAIIPKPPEGVEPQEYIHKQLDSNKTYQTIWRVLQALRSHDERFEVEIEQLRAIGAQSSRIKSLVATDERSPVVELGGVDDELLTSTHDQLTFDLEQRDFLSAINAKIVEKVGDRHYWRNWGQEVADIAIKLIGKINSARNNDPESQVIFIKLLEAIRKDCNPSVDEDEVVELLAQAIITEPVFNAIFKGGDFVVRNPVFQRVRQTTRKLEQLGMDAGTESLAPFYDQVAEKAKVIEGNSLAKQELLKELFEQFFAIAASDTAKKQGIAYTPTEGVDFMLHSCDYLINKVSGRRITDPGIDVLDPFAGTGAFISRLIANHDLIREKDIKYKYKNDLYASEIQMLSYLMTSATTEEAIHARIGDDRRRPFAGVVLRDSFLGHKNGHGQPSFDFEIENSTRARAQDRKNIEIIIGNPPYSAGQNNANDDNKNDRHAEVENHIASTYVANSSRKIKAMALYDSYFKAFRWASTRVAQEYGVVAFLTNNGWLDGIAANGFRATIAEEFAEIYVLNLRGNCRTAGERRRKESDNFFTPGFSKAGAAMTFLVKNQKAKDAGEPCKIYYKDIGDYKKRNEKLGQLVSWKSIEEIDDWVRIEPDQHNDWIDQRIEYPANSISIVESQGKGGKTQVNGVFAMSSLGVVSSRDAIAYGSAKEVVEERAKKAVSIFNRQVAAGGALPSKETREEEIGAFKWHDAVKGKVKVFANRNEWLSYMPERVIKCDYRPFFPQWCDYNLVLNHSHYSLPNLFPNPGTDGKNMAIAIDEKNENLNLLFNKRISDKGTPPPALASYIKIYSQATSQSQWQGEAKGMEITEWLNEPKTSTLQKGVVISSAVLDTRNLAIRCPQGRDDWNVGLGIAINDKHWIAGATTLLARFRYEAV